MGKRGSSDGTTSGDDAGATHDREGARENVDGAMRKKRRADRPAAEAAEAVAGGAGASDLGEGAQAGSDAASESSRSDADERSGSDAGHLEPREEDGHADGSDDGEEAGEAESQPVAKQTGRQPKRKAPEPKPPKVVFLPWMRTPVTLRADDSVDLADVGGLDPRVAAALRRRGISSLFPVQAGVWREWCGGAAHGRDLCVCAPTGSGKTLAYALPVAQALSARVIRRVRALVVLPTHDLAQQVAAVMRTVCGAVQLDVGVVAGKGSLRPEADALVEWRCGQATSRVDVLVGTPGRLIAHLRSTTGFTLEHLTHLVVDETDRMLRQAYQEWLPQVLLAAQPAAAAPLDETSTGTWGAPRTDRSERWESGLRGPCLRVRKLLLSATLTQDPSKIARLSLHAPRMLVVKGVPSAATADAAVVGGGSDGVAVQLRYNLPESLTSFKVEAKIETKALTLVALLDDLKDQATICFTASVESTHRLFLLLSAVQPLPVAVVEYSSHQTQSERSTALGAFKTATSTGRGMVLVASDAMTRGMDIKEVNNVVNYDAPMYAKTYVHRVGRTARAGATGRAFTLLCPQEAVHFKRMLAKVGGGRLRNHAVAAPRLQAATRRVNTALAAVQRAVRAAEGGRASGGGGGLDGGDTVAGATPAARVARMQAAHNFRAMRA